MILEGTTIIDAGNLLAGPVAASLLSELGARVIKIEHPELGDSQRRLEPIVNGEPVWWKSVGRNKECITLNLSDHEGQEIFRQLVSHADVVIENYRPGTFERWNIGPTVLHKLKEDLIILRVSGFGQTGPYRERPGFGRIAEAMSGLTYLIGEADGAPMSPGYPLGDLITAIFGAYSVLAALIERERKGGKGEIIDLAMYEALTRLLEFDAAWFNLTGTVHSRRGNEVEYAAPSSTFQSADGVYITLAASNQKIWERLCIAMEAEELLTDPNYATLPDRVKIRKEVNELVASWMLKNSYRAIERKLLENEVPFSKIYNAVDMCTDEHFKARETLVKVKDPALGEFLIPRPIPRFSNFTPKIRHLGRALGADTNTVLTELIGLKGIQLQELRRRGVI